MTAIEEFVPDVNSIMPPEIQRFEFANPTLLNCVIDSFWDCRRVYKDPFTFFSEREILEVFGFSKDGKVEIRFYLNNDGSINSYFPKKK